MKNTEARIAEQVDQLIGNLNTLVGEMALEAIAQRIRRRPTRRGGRRSTAQPHRKPEEIEALAETLHSEICRSPGETMLTLSERVKQPAKILAVPTRKLLDAGRIKKTGQRQFTRYFPVGRDAKRARRRKAR